MLVDYRVRCETDTMIDGIPCRVTRYGMSKAECNVGLYCPAWYDVGTHYHEDYYEDRRGRTTPIENENPVKHFFNKRIMTDEEKTSITRANVKRILADIEAQALQDHSDSRSVGALDGEGSTSGVGEVGDGTESSGCSDSHTGEEVTS